MNENNFLNFLTGISVPLVIKLFVLFIFLIYIIFAFILIRQVASMTRVLDSSLSPFLKLISWLPFLVSLGIFIAIIIFL